MHAYRFRLMREDHAEFVRDVDVLANQTFEDLHSAFVSLFALNTNELASFYICDHKWRRMKELTLIDMQHNEYHDDEDDDFEREKKNKLPVFVMNQAKIKDMIDDPHQRLIYEYDFLSPVVFYIELMKIVPGNPDAAYPVCVRSEGEFVRTQMQKKYAHEDFGEDLLTTEDDLLDDTFEVNNDDATLDESNAW